MTRLDPRLRHLMRQRDMEVPELAERVALRRVAEQPDFIEVLVRCVDNQALDKLRAAGMRVHFASHGAYTVASGEIVLDVLERLSQSDFVARVEASRQIGAELDISRVETRVEPLHHATPPLRGSGVIIGIIDGGIDYTHPDFRHEDGSSRILFLWDQGAQSNSNSVVPYGREYTKTDLDAALKSPNPFTLVPHGDITGHGTHVAGIAAGTGSVSGGIFRGIAPDAELIVVALRLEKEGTALITLGRSKHAFDAYGYIIQRADGRSVVINQSQGMNGGGHSGETVLETGLDNFVRQPNATVVKAAGNEQSLHIHAGGQISQGQTVSLELQLQANTSTDEILEVWYDSVDRISVAVQPTGSELSNFVKPEAEAVNTFTTPAGNNIHVDFDLNIEGVPKVLILY